MTLRQLFPNFAEHAIGKLIEANKDIENPNLTPEGVGLKVCLKITKLCADLHVFVRVLKRKEFEQLFITMRVYLLELMAALQELQQTLGPLIMKETTTLTTLVQAYERVLGIVKREEPLPMEHETHPDLD